MGLVRLSATPSGRSLGDQTRTDRFRPRRREFQTSGENLATQNSLPSSYIGERKRRRSSQLCVALYARGSSHDRQTLPPEIKTMRKDAPFRAVSSTDSQPRIRSVLSPHACLFFRASDSIVPWIRAHGRQFLAGRSHLRSRRY